jgi:dipeptidyl aminopeptidase/acylaminoacyl peptidase
VQRAAADRARLLVRAGDEEAYSAAVVSVTVDRLIRHENTKTRNARIVEDEQKQWLGNQPNRDAIAKAASPLTYVRAGLPPTISIHGDSDPTVPYAHSVRLQEALQKTGVPHELITIPGGGHGNFRQEEWQRAYTAIQAFLTKHVTGEKAPPSRARE